jgi:hypothetical protein
MEIEKRYIEEYIKSVFGSQCEIASFSLLGAGAHGSGYLLEIKTPQGLKKYVLKDLKGKGLGHDYPSDRASVFLWDKDYYSLLPHHVKAIDVVIQSHDQTLHSMITGREYYLLMEEAEGTDYFHDLESMARKKHLDPGDRQKISLMVEYLVQIHRVKKHSPMLYLRKLRDTIGHGECLMGVFDTYPEGILSFNEMAEIEKLCIDQRAELKPLSKRLCQIHGDFHPGNILFQEDGNFLLLDRSRGPWGDAADDVTALTMNYIFFSINKFGLLQNPYEEALNMFFNQYVEKTDDKDLFKVAPLFFAFRGAVVANPLFYPHVSFENRQKIFRFIRGMLHEGFFRPENVNACIDKGESRLEKR